LFIRICLNFGQQNKTMKTQNVPMDKDGRLTFNANQTSVKEAKRKASIIYNRLGTHFNIYKPLDEFNYVTENGTYVFYRRNIICPNNTVTIGNWR